MLAGDQEKNVPEICQIGLEIDMTFKGPVKLTARLFLTVTAADDRQGMFFVKATKGPQDLWLFLADSSNS